jgi:hypothetical protein
MWINEVHSLVVATAEAPELRCRRMSLVVGQQIGKSRIGLEQV